MEGAPIEIVDLRRVSPEQMGSLLAAEAEAWEKHLLWDYTATAALIRRFLEGRALNGYAALRDGQAIGFTFYIGEAGKGLVGDVFVRPEDRSDAIYAHLLTHTLETLEATPGIRRVEAQLLHADSPFVRAVFSARGYVCHDRSFLKLQLPEGLAGNESQRTCLPGYLIVAWEGSRFLDSANLITRSYAGHIDCEVSDQYRTQAGAMRFLDNIIHYPGCGDFFPPASLLAFPETSFAASPESQPCGMLLTSVVKQGIAHITQLCVSPEYQGSGVGKSLLRRALATLVSRNFHTVTLTVTNANRGALKLYQQTGFSLMLQFPAFVWDSGRATGSPLAGYSTVRS